MDSLCDWNTKFALEYQNAKKKLSNINECSSIKSNYSKLANAPEDHPIHQLTEKDYEESLSENDLVFRLRDALKEGIDTFSIPELLNEAQDSGKNLPNEVSNAGRAVAPNRSLE